MTTTTVDWASLRARRSPYWRPGMNTQREPYVVIAETSLGRRMVPCGPDVDRAREVLQRWKRCTELGVPLQPQDPAVCVGAAVIDPRGDVVEAWKIPGGTIPDPLGEPRWLPISVTSTWVVCRGCGARRWPGCYLTRERDACRECLLPVEVGDPRCWPDEPPEPVATAG